MNNNYSHPIEISSMEAAQLLADDRDWVVLDLINAALEKANRTNTPDHQTELYSSMMYSGIFAFYEDKTGTQMVGLKKNQTFAFLKSLEDGALNLEDDEVIDDDEEQEETEDDVNYSEEDEVKENELTSKMDVFANSILVDDDETDINTEDNLQVYDSLDDYDKSFAETNN